MTQVIGRGEDLFGKIISRLYTKSYIIPQWPLEKAISIPEFEALDPEIQKHKFDFAVTLQREYPIKEGSVQETFDIIVEVNYKHGEKAARKWSKIFVPLIKKQYRFPVEINDYDCRNLFKLDSNKQHKLTWDDFRDVIDALENAGVEP